MRRGACQHGFLKMKKTAPRMQSPAHRKFQFHRSFRKRSVNGTKTVREMHSWRILSCATEYAVDPIRFAGTARQYSKKAIAQDARIARMTGRPFIIRRCPYHANAIMVFDAQRSSVVRRIFGMAVVVGWDGCLRLSVFQKDALTAEAPAVVCDCDEE